VRQINAFPSGMKARPVIWPSEVVRSTGIGSETSKIRTLLSVLH
jgi:hypothetical protein